MLIMSPALIQTLAQLQTLFTEVLLASKLSLQHVMLRVKISDESMVVNFSKGFRPLRESVESISKISSCSL